MKIISGGQTGVDRAALDVAIERGMRLAAGVRGRLGRGLSRPAGPSGAVSAPAGNSALHPSQRTEWNVRDSDATLIVTDSGGLVGIDRHAAARISGPTSTASRSS